MSKIIFCTWIFFLIVISCNTEQKKDKKTGPIIGKTEDIIKNKSNLDNPMNLSDFSEIFGGVWLPKKYVTEIQKSKSAYLSRNSIPEISELTIHKRNVKNDTLFIGSSLNNHEGYGFNIWNSEQQIGYTFSNNIFDWEKEKKYHFTYDFAKKSISIICKNSKGQIETQVDYIKVLEPKFASNYGGAGYEYISRKFTINGTYQILDSLKNDLGIINFDPMTGQTQNFKFGYYTITTDFIGPHYPSDHILLRLEPKEYSNQEYLSIINKNDTILLYDTKEIITDSTYDIGLKNIKYYMINKNY